MEKKEELVPMNEVQNVDETDVNEKSPLQNDNDDKKESEGKQNGKEKSEESSAKNRRSKPFALKLKRRLVIAIIVVTLFMIAAILIAIGFGMNSREQEKEEELGPRFLNLIPTPNAYKQTIRFKYGTDDPYVWRNLTQEMREFLQTYKVEITEDGNITQCKDKVRPENKECVWDISEIENLCNSSDDFGYRDGSPCVFLVFNKELNFTAESYNETDLISNPEVVHANLTEYKANESFLYVDCKPDTDFEKERIINITYAPASQNFPQYYFPYTGSPEYMSPFIAIKIEKPARNMYIGITCRLWAKNFTSYEGLAATFRHFNLFVE